MHNTLKILSELFTSLENESIRYCHWKSNQHLADAVAGRTDVDLLVDNKQAAGCESVLLSLGYKRFLSQPWARYPGLEDWIGFDDETGRLVHIHLHYQLIMGKKFVKNLYLPWGNLVLDTAVREPQFNIYVTDPNLEIILLLIRVGLKTSLLDLRQAWRPGRTILPSNILNEFNYLLARIDEDVVAAYANDLLPEKSSQRILSIIRQNSLESPGSILHLKSGSNQLLDKYHRHGKVVTTGMYLYRRTLAFSSRVCRKLRICDRPGKRLHSGGVTIAIIGCDGSGKSTITRELQRWLSWKIDTRLVYLGTGDGSVGLRTRWLQRMSSSMAPKRAAAHTTDTARRKNKSNRFTLRRLGSSLLALSIADERQKKLMSANRAKLSGTIVVTDRFPQNQFVGIFDGPKLNGDQSSHGLQSFFAQQEQLKYEEIAACAPDVVVKLHVPAEVALARKSEHSVDYVRRKAEITGLLSFPQSKTVDIDASQPLESVIRSVKSHIWKSL